jgi:hypothetical protein
MAIQGLGASDGLAFWVAATPDYLEGSRAIPEPSQQSWGWTNIREGAYRFTANNKNRNNSSDSASIVPGFSQVCSVPNALFFPV